jgi:exodeoxyribonuclease V
MTALTQHQLDACDAVLREAFDHGFATLGGPAGSGKTTCISHLADCLSDSGYQFVICTPTHKAAQVLRKKGLRDATTYHSVFFRGVEETAIDSKGKEVEVLKFIPKDELSSEKHFHVGAVIIDEASMVSTSHIAAIRRMADVCILVGDPHQLPPVADDGGGLGVFNSGALTAELKEIHRQAEGSSILELASRIRQNADDIGEEAFSPSPGAKLAHAIQHGVQVICYTNDTRRYVNYAARRALGRTSAWPEVGDKMIFGATYTHGVTGRIIPGGTPVTVIAVDRDFVSNGQIDVRTEDGESMSLNASTRPMFYDLHDLAKPSNPPSKSTDGGAVLQYAYAITAHKAQGSEYQKVLVVDERARIFDKDPLVVAETRRRWFYTAVTRAKEKLFVVKRSWVGGVQ